MLRMRRQEKSWRMIDMYYSVYSMCIYMQRDKETMMI